MDPQTTQFIQAAKAKGYTDSQIQAVLKTKGVVASTATKPKGPNYFTRVKDAFLKGGEDIVQSVEEGASGQQSVVSAGLQTAGAAARTIFSPVTAAVQPGFEAVVDKLSNTQAFQQAAQAPAAQAIFGAQEKFQQWAQAHPEAAKNLQATIDISSALGGAKVAPGVAGSVVEGAGSVVSGVGRVAQGIGRVEGMLLRKPAAFLAKKGYDTAIGRTTGEAERILSYRANKSLGNNPTAPITRADTAREMGIYGRQTDIGVQSKVAASKLYTEKIGPALKQTDATITKNELFAPIEQKIAKTVDPSRRAELQDAYDAIKEDFANESVWSIDKAQQLKQGIDKFMPDKVFQGKPISNAYRELRSDMANEIRRQTYEKLSDVNIKKDYLNYSNLIELEKIGVKGLTDNQLKGGSGGFITGILDKVVTPVVTTGSKVLYKVSGTPLTFQAGKGIRKFGEFLKQQGFNIRKKDFNPAGSSVIKRSKEILKTQGDKGGFIKNPLAKRIASEDAAEMADFTDFVAGKYKPKNPSQLKLDARRIAKRYGLAANVSDAVLRNKFTTILDKIKFRR